MKVLLKYIHIYVRAGNTKIQFKMIHIEPLVFIFNIHVLSNVPPVNIQSQLT